MPLENVHTPEENLETRQEKTSTNEIEYKNPSKQITEENDKKVNEEKESADAILPEEQEKKRLELAQKVNIMEEGETKDSYMKLLGMVKTKMNEDDCNWEESYIMLNRIEEKINNGEKVIKKNPKPQGVSVEDQTPSNDNSIGQSIKSQDEGEATFGQEGSQDGGNDIETKDKIMGNYKNIDEIRKSMNYIYKEEELINKMDYEDKLIELINQTQNIEDKEMLQKELERSFIEPLISNNFLEKTGGEIKGLYNNRKKYEIKNNGDKIEVSTRLKENEKPSQPTIFTKEELLK